MIPSLSPWNIIQHPLIFTSPRLHLHGRVFGAQPLRRVGLARASGGTSIYGGKKYHNSGVMDFCNLDSFVRYFFRYFYDDHDGEWQLPSSIFQISFDLAE